MMFLLKDRAIVEISGLDRQEFLQGLITNDIKLAMRKAYGLLAVMSVNSANEPNKHRS